jgi:hypothetical protein
MKELTQLRCAGFEASYRIDEGERLGFEMVGCKEGDSMRCGGKDEWSPIQYYSTSASTPAAADESKQHVYNNREQSTHSDTSSRYITPPNALYNLFMLRITIESSHHWTNRAHYHLSHEVYICSMTRQLLPRD